MGTIVLEVNEKPISFKNAKLVFSGFDYPLYFDRSIDDINKQLNEYKNKNIDKNKLPLICVIGKGYFIGRCQPVVGGDKKQQFINNLLTTINQTCGSSNVVSVKNKVNNILRTTDKTTDKNDDIICQESSSIDDFGKDS